MPSPPPPPRRQSSPPPPPKKAERRAHPRVDLLAQVQVNRRSEVHILPAINVSRGGLFLKTDPERTPDLTAGVEVELLIFPADGEGEDVALDAEVVRVERSTVPGRCSGVGLRFLRVSDESEHKLERILAG